jgi:hypothetical protein
MSPSNSRSRNASCTMWFFWVIETASHIHSCLLLSTTRGGSVWTVSCSRVVVSATVVVTVVVASIGVGVYCVTKWKKAGSWESWDTIRLERISFDGRLVSKRTYSDRNFHHLSWYLQGCCRCFLESWFREAWCWWMQSIGVWSFEKKVSFVRHWFWCFVARAEHGWSVVWVAHHGFH